MQRHVVLPNWQTVFISNYIYIPIGDAVLFDVLNFNCGALHGNPLEVLSSCSISSAVNANSTDSKSDTTRLECESVFIESCFHTICHLYFPNFSHKLMNFFSSHACEVLFTVTPLLRIKLRASRQTHDKRAWLLTHLLTRIEQSIRPV